PTALRGATARVERIRWQRNSGGPPFELQAGTEQSRPAQLVLLAMGFLGPEPEVLDRLGVERDQRGNAAARAYLTTADGVFAAGDARRGQSLVVWAVSEGGRGAEAGRRWLDGGATADEAARTSTFVSIATTAPPG